MKVFAAWLTLTAIVLGGSPAARADIEAADLPAGTVWYFHADIARMRSTDAGRDLYGWLENEVVADINDEFSIDLGEEVERVTAFSNDGAGLVAIVEGPLSESLQERVLALARSEGNLEEHRFDGAAYYRAGDDDGETRTNDGPAIRHSGYFTFAVPGKLMLASEEQQLRELMASNGTISGAGSHADALFVLSADKQFVQAGMRTARFADAEDDWESNILRNTEQAAVLIADRDGMIAVAVKLVSKDPALTESLGNIVNGLIALQVFTADVEPDVASALQNTRVEADGAVLSVSTVLDPALVVRALGD